MLKIEKVKYKAVIFDMDGTMVDSNPWHKKALEILFKKLRIPFSGEYFKKHIVGHKNSEFFPKVFPGKSKDEINKLSQTKEGIFRDIYKPYIKEVDGLTKLIDKIKEKGLLLAIATTAPKENRELILSRLGFPKKLFSVILGDEDVKNGKPNPEIYLKTAKKLRVKPKECLVFEDSTSGIKAAKSAVMTVIAISTNKMPETLKEADFVVNNFNEVELEDFIPLANKFARV